MTANTRPTITAQTHRTPRGRNGTLVAGILFVALLGLRSPHTLPDPHPAGLLDGACGGPPPRAGGLPNKGVILLMIGSGRAARATNYDAHPLSE